MIVSSAALTAGGKITFWMYNAYKAGIQVSARGKNNAGTSYNVNPELYNGWIPARSWQKIEIDADTMLAQSWSYLSVFLRQKRNAMNP